MTEKVLNSRTAQDVQIGESGIRDAELTHIAKGAGITFIGRIVGRGLRYLHIIIVAKILNLESLGLYVLGLTIIQIAGVLGRLGLESGVLRYVSVFSGAGDKQRVKGIIIQALKYSFIASIIVSFGLFFTAEMLSVKVFHKPGLESVIKTLSVFLPFLSLALVALSVTQGFQIMKYSVYGQYLFWPVTDIALVVTFAFFGLKLSGVVISHGISIFFMCLLSLYFVDRVFSGISRIKAINETSLLFSFSLPLLMISFLSFIIMWTDTLMIGYFLPAEKVGLYAIAIKTSLLVGMILNSFNSIFSPAIADLYHKKEQYKLACLYKTVTKWVFTITIMAFLIIVLLSKEIMGVFGKEFVAGWSCLIILAIGQLANGVSGPSGSVITMSGRQILMLYNTMGIFLVNMVLNYILIPIYGILGAAVASAISITLFNVIMLVEVYILHGIHPYSVRFLKPLISSILSFAAVFVMGLQLSEMTVWVKIPLYLSVLSIIFFGLICILGFDEEDRLVLNVVMSKVSGVFVNKTNGEVK